MLSSFDEIRIKRTYTNIIVLFKTIILKHFTRQIISLYVSFNVKKFKFISPDFREDSLYLQGVIIGPLCIKDISQNDEENVRMTKSTAILVLSAVVVLSLSFTVSIPI